MSEQSLSIARRLLVGSVGLFGVWLLMDHFDSRHSWTSSVIRAAVVALIWTLVLAFVNIRQRGRGIVPQTFRGQWAVGQHSSAGWWAYSAVFAVFTGIGLSVISSSSFGPVDVAGLILFAGLSVVCAVQAVRARKRTSVGRPSQPAERSSKEMVRTAESTFMKIIRREVPSYPVYEDDKTFAFLDIYPTQPGHTLVVPKVQVWQLWDLDDEYYDAVMATCKRLARHIREVLQTERVGVQVVGLDVDHAHVHLVPFSTIDEFYRRPPMTGEPNHAALAVMAERLSIA